jgi:hypothetical protein
MFKKVTKRAKDFFKDSDSFAFQPHTNIGFNKKAQFSTMAGGVVSIILTVIFTYSWYQQLYIMVNYLANNISSFNVETDFGAIGTLNLAEMESIPFYGFYYKNKRVLRNDKDMCSEFGGDCF